MSGRYLVIEGNDGTGKSTQVAMLAAYLQRRGHEVVVVEEPGSDDPDRSTPIANELRQLIKNGQLVRAPEINVMLFSLARRELWQDKIQPALQRGAVVLSGRNYLSTIAYQGYGEGVAEAEIIRLTRLCTAERYMQPDATVILTAPESLRRQRIGQRGQLGYVDAFESRPQQFQNVVNQAYQAIAAAYQIPLVSAIGPAEQVQQKILAKIGQQVVL